ncbi:MAG: prolyl oligopeptidase family serine peptidase [Bacteroidetes bacterium]|nr:prolyl oligopeptidase family serine peptidase [Bacteroidota bacterium]MBS1755883.1 prolyl oligopeptidase family serine peptidase [Bacteroidota bacterium]
MNKLFFSLLLLLPVVSHAQKKTLTHAVYDGWKSLAERYVSNDGNYIVYAINPQEGDGEMIIQNSKTNYKVVIERGYNAVITNDSRFAVLKIKPPYQATRQAKIKKVKSDDMPKDSLAIVTLGKDSVIKISRVQSYKTPEEGAGWLAYQLEKPLPEIVKKNGKTDSLKIKIDQLAKVADSVIRKSLDSVKGKIERQEVINAAQKAVKEIYKKADAINFESISDAEGVVPGAGKKSNSSELIVKNLNDDQSTIFKNVSEYLFDKNGKHLVIEFSKDSKDSNSKASVILWNLATNKTDTVLKGFNDVKSYSFDDEGEQLAFLAERDSSEKALQKFYKLWYYKQGMDSSKMMADKNTVGMHVGNTVSENGMLRFSKNGTKLYFGVAPVPAVKDTNLVDFELARLDVWNYKDDYLQPQQLKRLQQDLKRSYTAVLYPSNGNVVQVGEDSIENVEWVQEGNANWALGQSSKNNRIASQWEGRTKNTAYIINTQTGVAKEIAKNEYGFFNASPGGHFVYWYNPALRQYFAYNVDNGLTKNITLKIKEPLYDIENDVPDFPSPKGIIGWTANDKYILLKDVYDIWQVDPNGVEQPKNITNGFGKKNKIEFNYVRLDPDKKFLNADDTILLAAQNLVNKYGGFFTKKIDEVANPLQVTMGPYSYAGIAKAKYANKFIVQRANSQESELYTSDNLKELTKITNIASQQNPYNWYTAELLHWKMFDGKMSEGILYKPENFDPKKKYPVIFYFYEKNSNTLFNYKAPAPSASTVNIPYFVSNDYLIFDPNIYYKTGEPGQSAYNSVVSAAKYLSKMPWVDSTKMAIQGQSWGGYQVAYLVTRTNIFRAAEAGAPVANMTSAYGGIRWGTGLNRQFQYEKTQSRIGATLWQRPDLYIKNSPLFNANKISTPLLIMHNDADGSVPWYQGIELFTAMKRLGKKVWLLEYNGEDHNLVERKNRKDLSIRLAQFFDYYLKGARPANWIKNGLPATQKGIDWGLEVE